MPRLGWRLAIAARLFVATAENRLLSFVGLLSVGGLVVAVAVLVIVLSVMNGFARELEQRVLAVIPHGTLYHRSGGTLTDWQTEREQALRHEGITGVAPLVAASALLIKGDNLQGVSLSGVDPDLEGSVSILPRFMVSGSFQSLKQGRFKALLGAELASKLGLALGDSFTLVLPDVRYTLAGPVLTSRKLELAGIFKVGADIDGNQIILSLNDAMKLKRQTGVDGLVVKTRDLFDAPFLLRELAVQQGYFAESWQRRHGSLHNAIQTQKATMFLLLLVLVSVATFNVVSNLVMTVEDSKPKIAVLRTLGASPADLRFIFLLHGLMVGVMGVLLGLAAGVLITLALSPIFALATDIFGLEVMTEYFIRYLPTDIQLTDLAVIAAVAFVICLLATLYPASKAARAQPARILAHDF